jgi:N-acetylmuramoyl-L-alanine amidase
MGIPVIRLHDIDVLARTIYGEARGEPYEGKWGVGRTVVNRWKAKKWFSGDYIAETAQLAWQYSCWNRNDPNRQKLLDATYDDKLLRECMKAAMDAIHGAPHIWLNDTVCHYHADHIRTPNWAEGQTPAGRLGNHLFFAGID